MDVSIPPRLFPGLMDAAVWSKFSFFDEVEDLADESLFDPVSEWDFRLSYGSLISWEIDLLLFSSFV